VFVSPLRQPLATLKLSALSVALLRPSRLHERLVAKTPLKLTALLRAASIKLLKRALFIRTKLLARRANWLRLLRLPVLRLLVPPKKLHQKQPQSQLPNQLLRSP
jgi:hypothetical protein